MTTCIAPVNVTISLASPVVSAQGMGTLLIVSDEPKGTFTGRVKYYSTVSEFIADGDAYNDDTSSYTYTTAVAAFSAGNTPSRIGIGRVDTLDASIAATLTAIMAEDSTGWYGIIMADVDESTAAFVAAAAPLSPYKLVGVQTYAAADYDPVSTTDVPYVLQQLGYENVITLHSTSKTHGGATALASWMADRLAINPDTDASVWFYVTLVGETPDELTTSNRTALDDKNCNYYCCMCAGNGTNKGVTVNGSLIDQVVTKHWMVFRLTETVCAYLKQATDQNTKVPYTDNGMAAIGNLAQGVFDVGIEAGSIANDPAPSINMPLRANLSAAVINSGLLSFSFTAEPTGAIATVDLSGTLSVAL